MRPQLSILILASGATAVLLAYGMAFVGATSAAPWCLAIGAVLVLTGLGLLGAGPRAPRLAAAVLAACSCTMIGFAVALLLSPHTVDGPLLLGVPRATALLLVVTGAVPLLMLPLAYAWAFPREVNQTHSENSADA